MASESPRGAADEVETGGGTEDPGGSPTSRRALDRTAAEMRAATATAAAVLKAAVDGVVVIDSRGTIQSVNPAVEQIFGYAADEMVGSNVQMLMPPPYHDEHDGYIANYLRTGRRKIIGIGREVVGRRKGGSTFPMDLAVSEVVLDDQISFVGTIRDITERKRLQLELQRELDFSSSIVETAPAIVLVLDPRMRVVRYNRYLERLAGRPLSQMVGHDWVDNFAPESEAPAIRETFRRCLDGHSPPPETVHSILASNGEARKIAWYCTPLHNEDEVTAVLAVGLDVTDREALEAELRQAQKMEAVGRLAGGVAHDFNTILGAITGYCELILSGLDHEGPAYRQALQVQRAAERGATLTRQLLAFSRRRLLSLAPIDLNAVVKGMCDMLHRLIGEDIQLQLDLAADLWPTLADRGQIEQVIVNLVVNARDAIAAGGRITLETRNRPRTEIPVQDNGGEAEEDCVLLAVTDDGSGMDEPTRQRVFEPFFTTKAPGRGTGLGLSMVYGTIQQSGGTISVHSTRGEGTRFEILLPRTAEVSEPDSAETETPVVPAVREQTVLVVEDDPIFLEMLRETLEAHGYRVLTAERPLDALEIAEAEQPAALVSDVVMPGMSGFELAERLRESRPHLRILWMSGYAEDSLRERGLTPAAGTLLQKPFKSQDLLAALHRLLEPGDDRQPT